MVAWALCWRSFGADYLPIAHPTEISQIFLREYDQPFIILLHVRTCLFRVPPYTPLLGGFSSSSQFELQILSHSGLRMP